MLRVEAWAHFLGRCRSSADVSEIIEGREDMDKNGSQRQAVASLLYKRNRQGCN